MNVSALVMMIPSMGIIAILTVCFFWKVLTAKERQEPDSYSGNDDSNIVKP